MSSQSVTITTEIDDDRTIVRVAGSRSAAVVVESAAGERVYLPPEAEEGEATPYRPSESPYDGTSGADPPRGDSPYDGTSDGVADSPYEGMSEQSPYGSTRTRPDRLGVTPTEAGFQVVHPEPVTDVRVLRENEPAEQASPDQSSRIDR